MPAQEKIKVLIVDDIAETRETVRKLLQFDMELEVVGGARSGKEAIELTLQLKPDVIVMDINMPDMDGITATEAVRRKVPYVQVIILSVQSDSSYMRRAMLAGARDFLAKPPSIDELTSAIHRAGIMAQEERAKMTMALPPGTVVAPGQPIPTLQSSLGKVYVVYSPKGGTGKTTIATNLALALHSEEKRAVLVDANPQFGDVAVFLNEQVKNNVLDLTPRVEDLDPDVVREVVITHNASGLNIIAAPPRPELGENLNAEQFGKLLSYLRQIYAYIIVDTASYLIDVVQSALEAADVIVLLTVQDIPAIKNANAFLTLMDQSGIKRERIMFVINRYDKRISISPERVGESLRQEVVAAIPFDDRAIVTSINRGVPIMMESKIHPISKSILALAELLKSRSTKLEDEGMIQGKK